MTAETGAAHPVGGGTTPAADREGEGPVGRILSVIENVLMALAIVILVAIVLGITADVIGRKFGHSYPQIVQLSEYSMLYLAFLPGPWLLRTHGHLTADLVAHVGKPALQALLTRFCIGVVLVTCLVAGWYSWRYLQDSYTRNATLYGVINVERWKVLLPMPIAFALMSLEAIRQLRKMPADLGETAAEL